MPSWWIDEPSLLGTNNPTMEQLREWYEAGFRTVISFLEEDVQPPAYDVDAAKAMGYARHNIPMRDYSASDLDAPDLDQYREFVKVVKNALKSGKVVIHCMAGRGRTGAMAVVYWIAKGLSAEQAIQKIQQVNSLVQFPCIQASFYAFEKIKDADR